MVINFNADNKYLFQLNDFAERFTWSGQSLEGIFDLEFNLSSLGNFDLEGTAPTMETPSGNVAGIQQGEIIAVRGVDYKLVREEQDGLGISFLILQKAV